MAQPTNLYDTYDARGLRESLADMIFNVSPTDTPFLSMMERVKAKSITEEWQTDSLAAAAANAQIDGDNAALVEPSATTRVHNKCQIMSKVFGVSGTLEAVDKAGRGTELGYQLSKKSAEIKRDLELALLANTAIVNGNATTARVMAGLPAWIATNAPTGTATALARSDGATDGVPGGWNGTTVVAATDGTVRAFLQTQLDYAIQQAYTNCGKAPPNLLAGPKQRQVFSGFDGVAGTVFHEAQDKTIIGRADVYMSNFGDMKVVPDRHIRQTSSVDREVFGVNPEYVQLAELRTFRDFALAKTGDSEKRQLLWEGTLKVLNEAAHIVVADLS